jgi:hypothetical protein
MVAPPSQELEPPANPGRFIGRQPFGIFPDLRDLALRRAVLSERRTGAALGDVQVLSDVLDAGATTRGAQ